MEQKIENVFIDLLKLLSSKNSLYNNEKFIIFSNVKDKSNIEKKFINLNEMRKFFNIDMKDALTFLYFNKDSLHRILYERDEYFILEEKEDNLSFYFYLVLLIRPVFADLKYSIKYIKDLINMRDSTKNEYRKILLVKIIDKLIKNYINIEDRCGDIEELENENNKIINEIQKVSISKTKIDELYIDIILNLIKNDKKDINSIIEELDIESINITMTIFNKIKDFLNDKEVIDKYLIKEINDVFYNEDKINFYYILLKLLKDSIFLYQIKFFLKTRKYFMKNKKKIKNYIIDNKEIGEKINYIKNKIFDLKYYINYINNNSDYSNMKETIDNSEMIKSSESKKREDSSLYCNKEKLEKKKNYYILNFVKIIGSHSDNNSDKKNKKDYDITKYTAEFIIETNKYYFSYGTNLKNSINKYSKGKSINFIGHGNQDIEDWIYNFIEGNSKIIGCGKNFIYIISGDDKKNTPKKEPLKNENTKILLCACKKYLKGQKNGILLLNIKNNEIEINPQENDDYFFFNTGTFEIYCICPLLKVEYDKNSKMLEEQKHYIVEDTFYFLIGGFEPNKNRGIIKLYKFNYDEKFLNKKIEYVQDIIINSKNKCFNGPISCITQSFSDEQILVTCWDGSVYLFNKPEIEYYLNENQKNLTFSNFFKNS